VALVLALALAPSVAAGEEGVPYVEHHMMFRSMATGGAANQEQLARCARFFADRRSVTGGSNLDYRVWGIEIDPASGLITDHNAEDLGPGFLCSRLPAPDGVAAAQSYAYMKFPGLPEFEVEGPCNPTATVNTGETFWHCKLNVVPDATRGIYGGFIGTNSVLLLGTENTQWPTGSIWIGYIVEAVR
jgi:hypothetical protein